MLILFKFYMNFVYKIISIKCKHSQSKKKKKRKLIVKYDINPSCITEPNQSKPNVWL